MVIKVKNLVKEFGLFKAVDNISFEVKKGEIFGLLGPNGAGKTTTIRTITGILKPTNGNTFIGEYDIQKKSLEAKQMIGVVPEMVNAYVDLSAIKNLLLMGELYGIEKEERIKKAEKLLKLFQLYEKKDQKVKTFSKGMKQRIIIAMALMNNSKILFLDEPTSGLDVESVRLIRKLIEEFNEKGITIFLTTHNIEEANQLCNRVAIMNHGRIVAIDRPEKLKHTIQSTSSIEVAFKNPVDKKKLKFKNISEIKQIGDKFRMYTEKPEEVIASLIKYVEKTNNKIIMINTLGPSLEDIFVKLTREEK
jgi:ABC-2 type transport system ATP-binding protein